MKKTITSLAILCIVLTIQAGSPEKMSYQAVVRNTKGALVVNQSVGMQISILQTTPTGKAVYKETQTTTTNVNGLVTIEIGAGTTTDVFSAIDWSKGPYYIKTEIDPAGGIAYSISATSQLLSVPFALYAKDVQNKQWAESGSSIYFNTGKVGIGKNPGADARQFQVLTESNQAIAAINNSTFGTIFAQNNGSGPAAEFRNKLLITDGTQGSGKVLTSDAAGYTSWQNPAVITDASLTGSGTTASPLRLSSFGASVGQVLKWTGTAWDNDADDKGPWTETADAIYNSSSRKFGLGINTPTNKLTLADASTSCYMNIQNSTTGYTTTSGLLIGMQSNNGWLSTYEPGNFYIGVNSQAKLTINSNGNIGIGTTTPALKLDVAGAVNLNKGIASGTALNINGNEAIWYNGTYFSWGYGATENYFRNKIFIGATYVTPTQMLDVNGNARFRGIGSGAYSGAVNRMADGTLTTATSDGRLKENVKTLQGGLDRVMQLRGVSFTWKNNPEYGTRIGFIAQEVEKILPELVFTNETDGYKGVNYAEMTSVVVEAIKELKTENDRLKKENVDLNERLNKLEKIIFKK